VIATLLINKFLWLCRILETQKQSPLAQGLKVKELHSRVTPVRLPPRTQFLRRLDHGILLDVNRLDKTSINSILLSNQSPTSEKWLGTRKVVNARPYDTWKTPKAVGDDFSLPNVPGGNIMFCFLCYELHKMKTHWRGMLHFFLCDCPFVLITFIFCINTETEQGNLNFIHTVPVVLYGFET